MKCCVACGDECPDIGAPVWCPKCLAKSQAADSYGVKGFDPGNHEGTVYGFPAGCSFQQLRRALLLDRIGPNLPLPADLSSCFKGGDTPFVI